MRGSGGKVAQKAVEQNRPVEDAMLAARFSWHTCAFHVAVCKRGACGASMMREAEPLLEVHCRIGFVTRAWGAWAMSWRLIVTPHAVSFITIHDIYFNPLSLIEFDFWLSETNQSAILLLLLRHCMLNTPNSYVFFRPQNISKASCSPPGQL